METIIKPKKEFTDSLASYRQEVVDKLYADRERNGKAPMTLHGVFGPETNDSDGYLEETIKPPDGGTLLKIYGCPFLFKGNISRERVMGLQMAKEMTFGFPRSIIGKSFIYSFAVCFKALFFRKRFIHDVDKFLWEIFVKGVSHFDIPPDEYNAMGRELKRAAYVSIGKVFQINPAEWSPPVIMKYKREQLGYLLWRIARFVILVFEMDNAYRFRFQDAFTEPDFFECLDRMLGRETRYGISHKLKFVRFTLKLALLLEPRVKRTLDLFVKELDYDKIKMDESDHYFSLRFKSYNMGGIPFEEREKEWNEINREKKVVFL